MALRFGNTTRLHHIDFPAASTESGNPTWEQTVPKTHSELKPVPQGNQTHKTGKVNVRIRKRQEKESTRKARQDRNTQSVSSTELKSEISNNGGSCNGFTQEQVPVPNRTTFSAITQQSAAMCYMNLTVEWDVLDSFSEFATLLELQNPICPAHLIDTPEKLLSVLSCEL